LPLTLQRRANPLAADNRLDDAPKQAIGTRAPLGVVAALASADGKPPPYNSCYDRDVVTTVVTRFFRDNPVIATGLPINFWVTN
jgi:hypothetical protein